MLRAGMNPLREKLQRLARLLLEPGKPAYSLRPVVLELGRILANLPTIRPACNEDIARGETQTSHGLALSPTMAAMCMDDYVRTIEFVRGAHAAIIDLRKQFPARSLRFLYAGCGPNAILALPLMAMFPSDEVNFTLLDIHPDSIQSAKTVIKALELDRGMARFEVVDATSYRINPELPPDVILVETMRGALEAEPQVAITRHLFQQCPGAVLLPEEVRVDLVLVNPSKEFDLESQSSPQRDRIPLGPVFVLNRESLKSWEADCGTLLPGLSVRLPDPLESRFEPMLLMTVRVYRNHILKDYDSGLTCPRRPQIEGRFKSGDHIQFRYELGNRPRLVGKGRDSIGP